MPAPKASDLVHVPVRLRVTVAREDFLDDGDLENEVRNYCADRLREQPLIVDVRRDQL